MHVLERRWFGGEGDSGGGGSGAGGGGSALMAGASAALGGGGHSGGHIDVVRVAAGIAPEEVPEALRSRLRSGSGSSGSSGPHGSPAAAPGAEAAGTESDPSRRLASTEGMAEKGLHGTGETNGAVVLLLRQKEKRARLHHSAVLPGTD